MSIAPIMKNLIPNNELVQVNFGGYMHTHDCKDGQIYDMENISGFSWPWLRPIRRRPEEKSMEGAKQIFYHNGWGYIKDGILTYNGREIGSISESCKTVVVGNRVVFWGDRGERKIMNVAYQIRNEFETVEELEENGVKSEGRAYAVGTGTPKRIYVYSGMKWEDAGNELEDMEQRQTGYNWLFCGSTYKDVKAEANTIRTGNENAWKMFKPGDAVEISGCTIHPENNKTAIIREINGGDLVFYEWTFKLDGEDGTEEYRESGFLEVKKKQPDMDVVFGINNRLFGAKDDTMYASKLGDPTNFYVFDGLTTDSWFQSTGTPGKFTGGIGYLGYPMFFKEHQIFKIFGSNAENYQFSASATEGVKEQCEKSLAIAGETLYYWSCNGLMAYQGGLPKNIAKPFGEKKYKKCNAASDGRRLYMEMSEEGKTGDQNYDLWCMDTETGEILREGMFPTRIFARNGEKLYALAKPDNPNGTEYKVYQINSDEGEAAMPAFVEFGRFEIGTLDQKYMNKLLVQLRMETGAELKIMIAYDDGKWETAMLLRGKTKKVVEVPVRMRRCGSFRMRIEGKGYWEIRQINRMVILGNTSKR